MPCSRALRSSRSVCSFGTGSASLSSSSPTVAKTGAACANSGKHDQAHRQERRAAGDRRIDHRQHPVGVLAHRQPIEGIGEVGLAGRRRVSNDLAHRFLLPPRFFPVPRRSVVTRSAIQPDPSLARPVGPLDDDTARPPPVPPSPKCTRASLAEDSCRRSRTRRHSVGRPPRSTPIQAPRPSRLPPGCSQPHLQPVRSARRLVEQQPHRTAVVGDDDVDVAVVVEVAERGAAADLIAREGRPRRRRADVRRSGRAPRVVEQLVLHPERRRLAALRLDDVDGAVGDEQVERSRRCRSRSSPCRSR